MLLFLVFPILSFPLAFDKIDKCIILKDILNKPKYELKTFLKASKKIKITLYKKHGYVLRMIALTAIFLFFFAPAALLMPLQVTRNFGNDRWRLTAIEMTFSIGMMLGGYSDRDFGRFQKPYLYHVAFLHIVRYVGGKLRSRASFLAVPYYYGNDGSVVSALERAVYGYITNHSRNGVYGKGVFGF
jgi:hypothetical protein